MLRWNSAKWTKRIKWLNWVLSILVILAGFVLINLLSARHFYRFDWRKKQDSALTSSSLEIIKSLEHPVEVYLFYDRTKEGKVPDFVDDLRPLLKEYKYASNDKIIVKFINRNQQPRVAEELALRFDSSTKNCVIIAYQDRFNHIPVARFYERGERKFVTFCGEAVLSNELLKLQNREAKKIIFSTGHGEIDIDSVHPIEGGSALKAMLYQEGYRIEKSRLDDTLGNKNAQLLVLAGPRTNFTTSEIEIVRQFLNNGASVLLLLSAPKICGLKGLLEERGIMVGDRLLLESQQSRQNIPENYITNRFADHKFVKEMQKNNYRCY